MRKVAVGAVGAGLLVSGLLAATPASASSTIEVGPSQSIQAAVDRAAPGATIVLKPGHYHQSVLISKGYVHIKGSGSSERGTVLEPEATPSNPCAKNGTGICVLDLPPGKGSRVHNVVIDNLLVENYKANGIFAVKAQNLSVNNVVSRNNGEYGIARFDTSGGTLVKNSVSGNGEAGLYIGDSPHANVFVAGNDSFGNGFGILYRHAQHALIQFNTIHDNCLGILAIAGPPPSGAANIEFNTVRNNNKLCKGNPQEIPFDYSGGGIVMLGSVGNRVANNAVLHNRGASPLSGGIVLVDGAQIGAPAASGNLITRNTAFKNAPADIVDHSGATDNVFSHNSCSKPSGLCH